MRRSVETVEFFPDRIRISAMTAVRISGFGRLKLGSGLISYRKSACRYSGHKQVRIDMQVTCERPTHIGTRV